MIVKIFAFFSIFRGSLNINIRIFLLIKRLCILAGYFLTFFVMYLSYVLSIYNLLISPWLAAGTLRVGILKGSGRFAPL